MFDKNDEEFNQLLDSKDLRHQIATTEPYNDYKYVLVDQIDSIFFQNKTKFYYNQLVWVCKSKGCRGSTKNLDEEFNQRVQRVTTTGDKVQKSHKQRHELFLRARIRCDPNTNSSSNILDGRPDPNSDTLCNTASRRRVQVQYAKGSTYWVHSDHVIPILTNLVDEDCTLHANHRYKDHVGPLIVVCCETTEYRRCCIIHCLPGYDNYFVEVGCDKGELVHKVATLFNEEECDSVVPSSLGLGEKSVDNTKDFVFKNNEHLSQEQGQKINSDSDPSSLIHCDENKIASNWIRNNDIDSNKGYSSKNEIKEMRSANRVTGVVIGYDKSIQSIEIARQRYPKCSFQLLDVFKDVLPPPPVSHFPTDKERKSTVTTVDTIRRNSCGNRITSTGVVAIDINGTRELRAVLDCIDIVKNHYHPRLIIVKSRALYKLQLQQQVQQQQRVQNNC